MMASYYVRLPGTGTILKTSDLNLWPEGKRVSATEAKAELRKIAFRELRKMLKPGTTVYTVLRHCSASGMSRRIDLYIIRKGGLRYLSGYAADLMGYELHKDGGLVVG